MCVKLNAYMVKYIFTCKQLLRCWSIWWFDGKCLCPSKQVKCKIEISGRKQDRIITQKKTQREKNGTVRTICKHFIKECQDVLKDVHEKCKAETLHVKHKSLAKYKRLQVSAESVIFWL